VSESFPVISHKSIHHCYSSLMGAGGGIKTYVESLLNHQMSSSVSDQILPSLKNIDQSQFRLLHLHGAELLDEVSGECPSVYTLHNHDAYCPSGTKYLRASKSCCDRKMSYALCAWGHIVDGCGSRRPHSIIQNLQRASKELETLKKLKIPVIANSNYVRRQLILNGLSPEQVVTLHCGTPIPNTTPTPLTQSIHQNQRILFVGRIVKDKGLEWLLRALTLTDPKIHLDIAGEGWDRTRMERLAKEQGLNNRITWHGWCDGNKLDTLYEQCFALIFPSMWPEPAGLVTLEAYARYRPVIASSVGGIPEHINSDKTGILIPANNIAYLASAINELAQNYLKARKMGEEGHILFLKRFTISIHIQKLQRIYEQCLELKFSPIVTKN
jgi:glycosyltransferase involved in cell wall biosynthesis